MKWNFCVGDRYSFNSCIDGFSYMLVTIKVFPIAQDPRNEGTKSVLRSSRATSTNKDQGRSQKGPLKEGKSVISFVGFYCKLVNYINIKVGAKVIVVFDTTFNTNTMPRRLCGEVSPSEILQDPGKQQEASVERQQSGEETLIPSMY